MMNTTHRPPGAAPTTLLHLDSSILGANSASRGISAAVVRQLTTANPRLGVIYRDLAAAPIAHLSGAYLMAAQSPAADHSADLRADLATGSTVLDEFLAADIVVIGTAFYNFTIPTQLKAWVDRILVAGRTFRYGEDGLPEGLAGEKRVILAIARGGFYGPGTPIAAAEHAETYLRTAFAFIGITAIETIAAEGLAFGPEARDAALAAADEQITRLAI